MADFTFKGNNGVLENRYVTYSELGLTSTTSFIRFVVCMET